MSNSILEFTTALGESARPNLFKVSIVFPAMPEISDPIGAQKASEFLTMQGAIPQSSIDQIEFRYRGRQVFEPGERSYQPFQCQIYNDINFTVRKALEQWSNAIRDASSLSGVGTPAQYKSTVVVQQLDRNGNVARQYTLINAWPQDVGEISLDYSNASPEQYPATFCYDYYLAS